MSSSDNKSLKNNRPLAGMEDKVCATLQELAKGNENGIKTSQLLVMGEDLYMMIRDEVFVHFNGKAKSGERNKEKKDKVTEKKDKVKNGEKKLNSLEKARIKNSSKSVMVSIKSIMEAFNPNVIKPELGLASETLEIRGITFMYIANCLINKKHDKPTVIHGCMGLRNFIERCGEYEGKSKLNPSSNMKISKTLINDIKLLSNEIETKYNITGYDIREYAPEATVIAKWDYAIPSSEIKPRPSQIEMMKYINADEKKKKDKGDSKNIDESDDDGKSINEESNYNNGYLLIYRGMAGTGKSTFVVSIAKMLEYTKNNKKLIFSCAIETVRQQVARWCRHADVSYTILVQNAEGHLINEASSINKKKIKIKRVRNSNIKFESADESEDPDEYCVTICAPNVASILLKHKNHEYVAVFDELNMGADDAKSKYLHDAVEMLKYLPKHSIIMSATLPSLQSLQPIVDNFKSKYPKANIKNIVANDIFIGCDFKTYDGEIVMPHNGCKNADDLEVIIKKVINNPFLARMYTLNTVKYFWDKINVADKPAIFENITDSTANGVLKTALTLLEFLSKCKNDVITKACESNVKKIKDKNISDKADSKNISDKLDTIADSKSVDSVNSKSINNFDFKSIVTSDAHKYSNMNLLVTEDPFKWAKDNFSHLISGLNAGNIIKKYNEDLAKHELNKKRREREFAKQLAGSKNDLAKEMQEASEMDHPRFNFPNALQVNTSKHLKKYCESSEMNVTNEMNATSKPRKEIDLATLPHDKIAADNETLLLLYAGIGVISESSMARRSKEVNVTYTATVLRLASEGQLFMLVADNCIAYGTNYPFERIFIMKEYAMKRSYNTIFQLTGRVARVGKSWRGEVIMDAEIAERLLHTENERDIETENIIALFNA